MPLRRLVRDGLRFRRQPSQSGYFTIVFIINDLMGFSSAVPASPPRPGGIDFSVLLC